MTGSGSTAAPLELRQVRKSFDDVAAIDGVDLRLDPGEILALVGPSGCGKSTLLRSIAGLVPLDSGEIFLEGELVEDGRVRRPPEARSTGLVFQDHALFPHLTVEDNVAFGIRNSGDGHRASRVDKMLRLVGLAGHRNRFPHELSGGERQRVALARALAPDPAIMLFDEPFASLDYNLRTQLRLDVVSALSETGTAAVFVTHDQREALSLGARIAVMQRGKVIQLGTPEAVFHRPVTDFVGAFMGTASFLHVGVDDEGQSFTALGPVELGPLDPAKANALVRPDDVAFVPDRNGSAEIVHSDYTGTHWLVSARLGSGEDVKFLTSHLDNLKVGQRGNLAMIQGHCQVVTERSTQAT